MNTKAPSRLLCCLALMVLVASACSSTDVTPETAEPQPEPTASSVAGDGSDEDSGDTDRSPDDSGNDTSDNSADTPTPEPTSEPPKNEPPSGPPVVIFSVFTSGGFVPVDVALSSYPELVVMSDGVVWRPGAQIAVFPPPLTPAIEQLQLTADQLDEITALLSSSGVPGDNTDFGSPNITDVGTTAVTLLNPQNVKLEAYALGFDDGVTAAQAEARTQLSALIGSVQAIVDSASSTGELTEPPALALLSFPGLGFQEDATVLEWPIEAVPLEQESGGAQCVVVEGDQLSKLWAAAATANTQTPWNIDGETKVIAFRPVFPHEDIC